MVAMVERSDVDEPESTGLASVRMMVREFIRDVHHPPRSRCGTCGATDAARSRPHRTDQRSISITMPERELTAAPPEAVCDECGHAQPRTVGDELPAEVTVTCVGRLHRRIRAGRSRHPCGRQFVVPGRRVASAVPVVRDGPARTRGTR
jgi:hypothetical protein